MDNAEPQISSADLDRFLTMRRQAYNQMLVREALVDGNVSPYALDAITRREIEAGRMAPDDELRDIARVGTEVLSLSRPSKGTDGWLSPGHVEGAESGPGYAARNPGWPR